MSNAAAYDLISKDKERADRIATEEADYERRKRVLHDARSALWEDNEHLYVADAIKAAQADNDTDLVKALEQMLRERADYAMRGGLRLSSYWPFLCFLFPVACVLVTVTAVLVSPTPMASGGIIGGAVITSIGIVFSVLIFEWAFRAVYPWEGVPSIPRRKIP